MDQRLLDYYRRELVYLRELGGEFAQQFPNVARHLGLDAFKRGDPADPYVERLLEGVAFLAARVQLKIDAEFPRFTNHLLEMIYPTYLAPMPSMAIVQLRPDHRQGTLSEGFPVPRHTTLRATLGKRDQTRCEYRTAHSVTLWPLEIASLRHSAYVGDLGELKLASRRTVRGTLRLRLRTLGGVPFQQLALDRLPLFVPGHTPLGIRLYELWLGSSIGMLVRAPDGQWSELLPDGSLGPSGFDEDQALLPCGPQSFQGYRLLQEYFALPSRFRFVELSNLSRGLTRCTGTEVEVVVLLDRHDPTLETGLAPRGGAERSRGAHAQLFCTPAINLFPRRADRIHLSEKLHEYHVIPDRARPLDLEVHSVTQVTGYGTSTEVKRVFRPFYACADRSIDNADSSYFTIQRRPRLRSTRQRSGNAGSELSSSYAGSDVFVALVDGSESPYEGTELRQLGVHTLCTNRDLPLDIVLDERQTHFELESGAPVEACQCVDGPSPPRPSLAWGKSSWRLISQLSLNYLSITNSTGAPQAAADGLSLLAHGEPRPAPEGSEALGLRELLGLYVDPEDATLKRQIQGVRSITSSRVVRRLNVDGFMTFARGIELTLECDETAFEGASVFLLGSVLERFFAKYASINSFTETVLRSTQRGEIMRWPARIGRRASV